MGPEGCGPRTQRSLNSKRDFPSCPRFAMREQSATRLIGPRPQIKRGNALVSMPANAAKLWMQHISQLFTEDAFGASYFHGLLVSSHLEGQEVINGRYCRSST